jgi:hypothetical protein
MTQLLRRWNYSAGHQWLTPIILTNLGDSNQEDQDLKPAWTNSPRDPILKKTPSQEKSGGMVQGICPAFKLQYQKKKKKDRTIEF